MTLFDIKVCACQGVRTVKSLLCNANITIEVANKDASGDGYSTGTL